MHERRTSTKTLLLLALVCLAGVTATAATGDALAGVVAIFAVLCPVLIFQVMTAQSH